MQIRAGSARTEEREMEQEEKCVGLLKAVILEHPLPLAQKVHV